MSTAVSTTTQPTELVPSGQLDQVNQLESVITASRTQIQSTNKLTRAIVMAKAMKALENAITPQIMSDFRHLMNQPLGFKTDRLPGAKDRQGNPIKEYSDSTIKRCIIVALLKGAELCGNQFNIIAGQCYLTKEYYERILIKDAGVRNLTWNIGPAVKHGERSAMMEAVASWIDREGNKRSLECVDNRNKDGLDMRIVVNAHNTSSPDELRGKGESKLLRRIAQQMLGDWVESPDDDAFGTVEGSVNEPAAIEADGENPNGPPFPEFDAVEAFIDSVRVELQTVNQSGKVVKICKDHIQSVNESEWGAAAQDHARDSIEQAKIDRITELGG